MNRVIYIGIILCSIWTITGCLNPFSPGLDLSMTAGLHSDEVKQLSEKRGDDLKLLRVQSDNVSAAGKSLQWIYTCCSTSPPDSIYFFHTTFIGAIEDSISAHSIDGIGVINEAWIDSDEAMTIAESEGGAAFRADHPGCKISASLSRPVVPNAKTWWYIRYYDNNHFLNIQVDAGVTE